VEAQLVGQGESVDEREPELIKQALREQIYDEVGKVAEPEVVDDEQGSKKGRIYVGKDLEYYS
jgi:hypothetical protein